MSSDSHKHILEGLDRWIELLNNPAATQTNRVGYLQEKRNRIETLEWNLKFFDSQAGR